MPVDPPPAGLEAEVSQHDPWGLKGAVAVVERRPHACVAEADDVGPAVAGDVGEEAWMRRRTSARIPARPRPTECSTHRGRPARRTDRVRAAPTPAAPRTRHRPRRPKTARERPGEDELSVVRARERQHPPGHVLPIRSERHVGPGRAHIGNGDHERTPSAVGVRSAAAGGGHEVPSCRGRSRASGVSSAPWRIRSQSRGRPAGCGSGGTPSRSCTRR